MSVPTPPDPRTPQQADAAAGSDPQHAAPPPLWPPTSAPPQTPPPQPPPGPAGPQNSPGQPPYQAQYPGQPQQAGPPSSAPPYPGQPYSAPPAPGGPSSAPPYPGQPYSAQPSQVQPSSGQPYQGQPYQRQPYQAQAYPGQPQHGQPYQGQPQQSQPHQGQPYQGQPQQGQPYQGQAQQGQPFQGQPFQGQPFQGQQAQQQYPNQVQLVPAAGDGAAGPGGEAQPGVGAPAPGKASTLGPGLLRGLLPNLLWEAVLLVAAVILIIVSHVGFDRGPSGGAIWSQLAIIGMLTSGFALSVRTGTPNLAVSSIAALCGYWYVDLVNKDMSKLVAGLVAVLAAIGFGLVLALIVGFTPVPAWAVTLGALFLVQGISYQSSHTEVLSLRGGPPGTGTFTIFAVLFIVGSIAGGVVMAIPAVRGALGFNRTPRPGETAAGWSLGKLLGAAVGLIGSSALAGLAGVLFANRLSSSTGLDIGLLPEALFGAALAGVSLLGGRAGVFGVVLAVLIFVHVEYILTLENVGFAPRLILISAIGMVALLLNGLIEFLGRRMTPKVTAP